MKAKFSACFHRSSESIECCSRRSEEFWHGNLRPSVSRSSRQHCPDMRSTFPSCSKILMKAAKSRMLVQTTIWTFAFDRRLWPVRPPCNCFSLVTERWERKPLEGRRTAASFHFIDSFLSSYYFPCRSALSCQHFSIPYPLAL